MGIRAANRARGKMGHFSPSRTPTPRAATPRRIVSMSCRAAIATTAATPTTPHAATSQAILELTPSARSTRASDAVICRRDCRPS